MSMKFTLNKSAKLTLNKQYIKTSYFETLVDKGVVILRKQHYIPINQFTALVAFLSLCFIIMITGYVWTTTSFQEHTYTIANLQQRITAARETSKALQIELSEGRDLPRILDRSSSLSYTEVDKVNYVERPNASPFELLPE